MCSCKFPKHLMTLTLELGKGHLLEHLVTIHPCMLQINIRSLGLLVIHKKSFKDVNLFETCRLVWMSSSFI